MKLKVSEDDDAVGYLYFTEKNKAGTPVKIQKSIRLFDLMGKYSGPDVVFDFNDKGELVGIEIVGD